MRECHADGKRLEALPVVEVDLHAAGGLTFWQQALQNGASRNAVAQGILTSAESSRHVLDQIYSQYLNRAVDPLGEQTWLGTLTIGGRAPTIVAEMILASDEFFSRAQ